MILKNREGLEFFTFSKFNQFNEIRHGIFTRNNGFSDGDFRSLNMGISTGDDKRSVGKNRNAVIRCMNARHLEFTNQVHKTRILVFSKNNKKYVLPPNAPVDSADAIITNVSGQFLAIQLADCQGILLYDPKNKVAANIHSGWRGSVQNIISTCVASMQSEFGCEPENIVAGISPSLGPCCAEFIHYRKEIPKAYWRFKDTCDHFDFWKISRYQLLNSGLLPQHIEISNICTKCNSHLFFSFRKKHRTGRFVSVIGLK